jgi:hypothetical protein
MCRPANGTDGDGSGQGPNPTVRANPLKTRTATAADGADAARTCDSGAAGGVVSPAVAPDDKSLEFEERAAIAELDGGLTCSVAERLSADHVMRGT